MATKPRTPFGVRSRERALELIERHHGVVVKGLGDGLMVAFQSARRAVACAREIQLAVADRNRDNPAQRAMMRIGLHTGEVIEEDGDLFSAATKEIAPEHILWQADLFVNAVTAAIED